MLTVSSRWWRCGWEMGAIKSDLKRALPGLAMGEASALIWKVSSGGTGLMSMAGESSARLALADSSRYRALLGVSSTIAHQPSVQGVLHSVRNVLSNLSGVYSAGLYLLTDDDKALKVVALDRASEGAPIPVGTEVACTGVAAQVLQTGEPVYLPDVAEVMLTFPSLAPFASRVRGRHCYLFPLATSRKPHGVCDSKSHTECKRKEVNNDVESHS